MTSPRASRLTRKARCDNLLRLFAGELIPQIAPPPDITIADWAEQNVWLGPDVTSRPGPYRTDYAPYQRGIMDAISDRRVERIVVMKAARTGITYSAALNPIGYHIAHDPCPILVAYPTEQMAKKFSKKNLSPFIRDCAGIRELVSEARSRDGENTLLLKMFRGGSLTLVGANSPNALRLDTAKIAIIDEADGEVEAREGDYIKLIENRTLTYIGKGRKLIIISTPKDKQTSLIEQEYDNSSREQWCLPCPSCGDMQPLEWPRVNFETVQHACRECGALHGKREWLAGAGAWIARDPDNPTRGFHINALVSPFVPWESLIEEFRIAVARSNAGDHTKLQVFVNTALGETWAEPGVRIDEEGLMARREEYMADVPDGVCAITVAADTQDNRLAVDVIGWGAGKESWRLGYAELWGDPRVPGSPVWGQLDEIIRKPYLYANGVRVPVVCTTIDMGGHAPDQVCAYAKARQGWNVWAARGNAGSGKPLLLSTVKSKVASATIFNLAVDTGKDDVTARLRVRAPGPGYCHFPRGGAVDYTGAHESVRGYDARYFAGLTAEKKVSARTKGGFHKYEWQKQPGQANEPFDLAVYNLAALSISKVNLDRIAERAPWMLAASRPAVYRPQSAPKAGRLNAPKSSLNGPSGNASTAV